MTDIVERLRLYPEDWDGSVMSEAANEIERLLKREFDLEVAITAKLGEVERLTRERDEQRAENAKLCDGIHRLERERDEARALLQATANDNARLAAIVAKIDRAQFDRWCSTSDIVERLRVMAPPACEEAANEIERLRFALGSAVSWADEMKRKEDEIERLRNLLGGVGTGKLFAAYKGALEEIGGLRAALRYIADHPVSDEVADYARRALEQFDARPH